MNELFLLIFSFIILNAHGLDEPYYTNFNPDLKWTSPIKYNIYAVTDPYVEFVKNSIDNFTSTFNSPLSWVEEPNWERLYANERYVIFSEPDENDEDPCGNASPAIKGPSFIFIRSESCGPYENMKKILQTLGFSLTILRKDRTDHVNILWNNIGPITSAFLNQSFPLMKSSDPSFAFYDMGSLLHPSAYYDDAIDPEKPIFEAKNPAFASSVNLLDEERTPTDNDKSQFKAIYGSI